MALALSAEGLVIGRATALADRRCGMRTRQMPRDHSRMFEIEHGDKSDLLRRLLLANVHGLEYVVPTQRHQMSADIRMKSPRRYLVLR